MQAVKCGWPIAAAHIVRFKRRFPNQSVFNP
jgi:hypothetical protein